jgi:hypothetical protein
VKIPAAIVEINRIATTGSKRRFGPITVASKAIFFFTVSPYL